MGFKAGNAAVLGGVLLGSALRALLARREPELRYWVPPGQDPAAVLGKLRVAGIPARSETVDGRPRVVVPPLRRRAHERAQQVLGQAPANLEGDPFAPTGAIEEG